MKELDYQRFILSTRPVLWLPLYRKGGDVIVSSDGYGHLATAIGATWNIQGKTFNGTSDYINCGNNSIFRLATLVTVVMWVKLSTKAGFLLSMPYTTTWVDPYGGYTVQQNANDSLSYRFNTDGTTRLTDGVAGSVLPEKWCHIALSLASGLQMMYLDGESYLTSSFTYTTINYSGTPSLALGVRNIDALGEYGQATIGDVLIYNRALSRIEIQQHYLKSRWRYS